MFLEKVKPGTSEKPEWLFCTNNDLRSVLDSVGTDPIPVFYE